MVAEREKGLTSCVAACTTSVHDVFPPCCTASTITIALVEEKQRSRSPVGPGARLSYLAVTVVDITGRVYVWEG